LLPISEHGYVQAPYETITAERYNELKTKIKREIGSEIKHEVEDKFCDSDKCTILGTRQ
jgi:hypothetical protein